jgi:hypothetical protein
MQLFIDIRSRVLPKDMVIIAKHIYVLPSSDLSWRHIRTHIHIHPLKKSQTIMTVITNIDQDDEAMEALPPRDKPFA